jgi:AcrR family transcriptional regulator
MALADEQGVEKLTMRRLGAALGVEAMSLYNHVANKRDLVSALVDEVVGEYRLPEPGPAWKASLRSASISANQALVRHPWAPALLLTFGAMPGRNWIEWSEAVLATLREAGCSPELAHRMFHAIEGHIDGHSLRAVNFRLQPADLDRVAADFLAGFDVAGHPYLVEHIEGHVRNEYTGKTGFEFGIDLILDGLELILRDQGSPHPDGQPSRSI